MICRRLGACAALLCLFAVPAWAQATIVSATSGVSFTASTDHSAVDAFGQPRVTRYDLDILNQATSVVVTTVNLGKPTPNASNVITVDPVAAFGTLAAGVLHVARVRAVNPSASSVPSANTGPFGIPAPLPAPGAPSLLTITP